MRRYYLIFLGTLAALSGAAIWALADPPPQPPWWTDTGSGTAILNGNTTNNHAAATVGQLKFVAYQAQQYLDQQLGSVGGAGPAVDLVINDFVQNTTTNFDVATTGQLKYVAQPFYDRLIQVGYNTTANLQSRIYYGNLSGNWTSPYPWPTPPAAPGQPGYNGTVYNAWMQQNYTPINLGQLKLVFSFDLGNFTLASNLSINSDGIPDAWKVSYGLDPFDPSIADENSLSDNLTNYEYYEADSDPPPPDDYTSPVPANFSVAGNASFVFPTTSTPQYAAVDLGEGYVVDMNDNGDVLFQSGSYYDMDSYTTYRILTLFYGGGFVDVPYTDGEGTFYEWQKVANDGTVMGWAWDDPDNCYVSPVVWDGNPDDDPEYPPDVDLSGYTLNSGIVAFTRDGDIYFTGFYGDEDGNSYAQFFDWDSTDTVTESVPILTYGPADPGSVDPIDLQLATASDSSTLDFVLSNFTYVLLDDDVTNVLESVDSQYLVNGSGTPFLAYNTGLGDFPSDGDHQFGNLTYPFLLNFDYDPYYEDSPQNSLYYLPGNTAIAGNFTDSANGNATVHLNSINSLGVGLADDGTLWLNGFTTNLTDLMDPDDAEAYSDFYPVALAGNNLFVAGDSGGDAVLLMPVTMNVTNRDDPRADWSDAQPQDISAPVYAGEIDEDSGNIAYGDMVSWKIPGTDSWSGVSFAWSALAPDGVTTIDGPSGDGANEWRISDNGTTDPGGNTTLTWAPGNYTITCNVTFPDSSTLPLSFTQQVGWRTEDYLVIGQIVTTHYHDIDAPALISIGNKPWDISSPTYEFRDAVLNDIADSLLPNPGYTTSTAIAALSSTWLPITEFLNYPWFGYWSLSAHSATPQGPFSSSYSSGLGNVTGDERLWMTQVMLNTSIDSPNVTTTINYGTGLSNIRYAGQFRILQNYQMKFLVNDDGTYGDVTTIHDVATSGTTKLYEINAAFNAMANYAGWDLDLDWELPSETNDYNAQMTTSSDGYTESGYATGRIGPEGRNANWRLFGLDAPWIYSEIIFSADPDTVVDTTIRTSADITWHNNLVTAGSNPFNNLNIYNLRENADLPNSDPGKYFFQRFSNGLLPMTGHLEYFINTGSSTWPGPGTPPSVE